MRLSSLEDSINQDNVVRFVDAFVEKLDIEKLGFAVIKLQKEGRPAFDRKVLLKLYFYGYLNGIRSSRRLERECTLNLELIWLLEGRRPNYHTISDFRKLNCDALCNTFKLFVLFLKDMDMIGGKTIAVDGTKARAHNSKKNNYNAKKIERHIKRIEEQTQSYLAEMDANDKNESAPMVKNVKEKLARLASQKIRYEQLAEQLEQSGERLAHHQRRTRGLPAVDAPNQVRVVQHLVVHRARENQLVRAEARRLVHRALGVADVLDGRARSLVPVLELTAAGRAGNTGEVVGPDAGGEEAGCPVLLAS
jgi:transposase